MGDDDDWFERALRDDGDDADGTPEESPSDADDGDGDADVEGSDVDADGAPDDPAPGDERTEVDDDGDDGAPSPDAESAASADERPDSAPEDEDDSDPFGGVRDGPSEPTSGDVTEPPPSDGPEFDDSTLDDSEPDDSTLDGPEPDDSTLDDPEDDTGGTPDGTGGDWSDFGSALENAPGPDGDGPTDDSTPFGGEDGGFGTDEGFGSGGGEFGMGGEEFGMGTGDFDAAGPPQSGPEEFDEENFESEIDRLDIGIDGLDEMILGGVPTRSLMVAIGSAGTGKTTFGLQFLNRALERGESAVFITLEESRTRILDTAAEKGWSFREYESEGRLAVVDLDPVEMANSLESIQSDLPRLVEEFGADRLVLDSVSLLEMMYDRPSKRRTRVFNFARSLKEAGVTTMLTSEASDDNPYVSRHGIVEYLADAVFVLQYVRPNDFRETRLAIEIQKIRDANHSRETKPYELTSEGISVYGRANIF